MFPTDIGTVVNDFLVENFKSILDYNFTAYVEKEFEDDIPEEIKSRRLAEVVVLQQQLARRKTALLKNKIHRVLVEGFSKKSDEFLMGRNSENVVVVFPKEHYKPGDYVNVYADDCTVATLIGKVVM